MPSVNELTESRFLRKDDLHKPLLVTIEGVEKVELDDDGRKESKYALNFQEDVKPMVLNKTNGTLIAEITGCTEMNDWRGTKIVLYFDPNVFFAGKRTGGIRVREARNQAQPTKFTKPNAPTESGAAFDPNEEGGTVEGEDVNF